MVAVTRSVVGSYRPLRVRIEDQVATCCRLTFHVHVGRGREVAVCAELKRLESSFVRMRQ